MADTQVTTIVQQIEAQGPAVVQRVSTQFADLACTADNARKLVESLHNGTSVTLSAQGKTATFTPTAKLGYGEAYIAMALAGEALRNAGVSGCATPDQWQSALLGGPLAAAGTTTSVSSTTATSSASSRFPGVLALRAQGQGWGQIARTTNVQLDRIVTRARSALNLGSGITDPTLSPTGRSSSEINRSRSNPNSDAGTTPSTTKGQKGKRQGQDQRNPGARIDRSRTDADTTPSSTSPTTNDALRPSTSTTPSTDTSPSAVDPSRSSSAPGQSTTNPGAATRPDE
jgi:hypothetical protein